MKLKLGTVVTIQTGYFGKTNPSGNVIFLQAKHVGEQGGIVTGLVPDLNIDKNTEKHLLHTDDILFVAKGSRNIAVHFRESFLAVASTSFFVMRINEEFKDMLLPEYITWFLNEETTQKLLKRNAKGSSILSISKVVLENLEITIPELSTQYAICEIDHLHKMRTRIITRLNYLKEKKVVNQLLNIIK